MLHRNMIRMSLLGVCLISSALSCSQKAPTSQVKVTNSEISAPLPATDDAAKTIAKLGVGFNLGNVFDRSDKGKPMKTRQEIRQIIDLYRDAGFKHVRIPTTWMDGFEGDHLADSKGMVDYNHPRFQILVSTIDYALSQSMYVILNTHHEFWLKDNYDGEAAFDEKFGTLWTNVASYFAHYPSQLIFEVLNEPERAFGDFKGPVSPYTKESAELTRKINEVGYRSIRKSDPKNANRIVLIMPNAQGNQTLLSKVYPTSESLPQAGTDPYLAASVHTYDSWKFCGQEGANENYPGDEVLAKKIEATAKHAKEIGIPVHYGEFGVGRIKNQDERNTDLVRKYYAITSKTILANGMAPTLWDDNGWFGLIEKDPITGLYKFKYELAMTALKQAPAQALPPSLSGVEAMAKLGMGFSLGNAFEKTDKLKTLPEMKKVIDLYRNAGFQHVRIPTTWMDQFAGDVLADSDGSINFAHPRFLQLVSLVDYALGQGMQVILNTHHEYWLKNNYQGQPEYDARFANLWKNIAQYFARYPKTLMFEVLNEPERAFGDFVGSINPYSETALQLTRQINEVGYKAIRDSDPKNADRLVFVMPNAQGNQSMVAKVYPLPETLPGKGLDPFVAISVHALDPYSFCGQDGSNTKYPGDEVIAAKIEAVGNHAKALGIGIIFGEFGVGRSTDPTERDTDLVRNYYALVTKTIVNNGMAATVWDDNGYFALVQKDAKGALQFKFDIVPTMMSQMPKVSFYNATIRPIIVKNCQSCHSQNSPAGGLVLGYEAEVIKASKAIEASIKTGTMPKDNVDFRDTAEAKILLDWIQSLTVAR